MPLDTAAPTDLDVAVTSAVDPPTATLAILVLFVLSILGVARRFLGTDGSGRA